MDQTKPQDAVPWKVQEFNEPASPETLDHLGSNALMLDRAGFKYPVRLANQLRLLAEALRNGTVGDPKPEVFSFDNLNTWSRSELIAYIEDLEQLPPEATQPIEVVFEFSGPHGNVGSVNTPIDAAMDLALQLFLAAGETSAEVAP